MPAALTTIAHFALALFDRDLLQLDGNPLMKTNPALGGRVFEQLAHAVSKRLRVADTELRLLEER